jgi:hypothetical protein
MEGLSQRQFLFKDSHKKKWLEVTDTQEHQHNYTVMRRPSQKKTPKWYNGSLQDWLQLSGPDKRNAYNAAHVEKISGTRKAHYKVNSAAVCAERKKYYATHTHKIIAKRKVYISKNRVKIAARAKVYYNDHIEESRATQKVYDSNNRAKISARGKVYYAKNNVAIRSSQRKYLVKKAFEFYTEHGIGSASVNTEHTGHV